MSEETRRHVLGSWFMKMKMLSTLDWIILPMLAVGYSMAGVATYMLIF